MDKLHALALLNDRWPRHLRFGTEFDLDAAVEVLVDAGKVLTTEQIEVTLKEIIRSTTGQRVPVKAITDRFRALVASEKTKQAPTLKVHRIGPVHTDPMDQTPWGMAGKCLPDWIREYDEVAERCSVEVALSAFIGDEKTRAVMDLYRSGKLKRMDQANAIQVGDEVGRRRTTAEETPHA